jgi:aconitate hydratase
MGVLPCQFMPGKSAAVYALDGSERFDLVGLDENVKPGARVTLVVHRTNGDTEEIPLILRLDTQMEADYVRHGGILPYILGELTKGIPAHAA